MSQSQDPGESVVAHDTRPTVRNTPEISTAPPTPNAESGPPNLPWTLPPRLLEEELEKRKTRFTNDQKAEAWKAMAQVVQRYSDEQIKRWNAEIDTYLVFAGLLSAIITAFNVETYLLLQPNTPDPTLLALQQISLQLSSFSTGSLPAFVNSTHPAFQQGDTPPPPIPLWAIWLNTLWFTSLIFSLSSASIGIMAKQWLNEYASGISSESEGGTSRQTARLRQYRLNNLIKWHVGNIINSIPVLLQVSVALFLAGLLVLLWTLHPAVAVVASVLASVLGVFTLSIVLLPSVKSGCAYLSPQSVALYYVLRRAPSLLGVSLSKILVPLTMYLLGRPQILGISTRKLANALWEWEPVKAPTWHGIEQSMVSEGSQSLDADIISTAYDIAMNPDLLATAAICLSELEPNIHVINCVERLQVIDESHFGVSPSPYVCAVVSATGSVIYDLWADSLLCHSTSEVQKITAHHHTDRHPISDLDDRLFRHFLWAERHLSGFEQGAVERVLLGLSLAACHVEEMSINTKTAHKMLHSIETVLIHCSRSKFSPRNVRYAAAAAYQRISEGPAPDIQHLDRFCVYMGATVIVLECILASQDVPQDDLGILVHPYADHTLLHLIGVLRHANEEDLAKSDQFWMYFFVLQLSNLVNIVTEKHGALPAIRTLFPQDRISALEHAVAAAQGVIRRWSQSENAYWHWFHNRAGYRETLEDKLAHLRAIRPESRSGSALQEAPPSTTSLYPTLPSAPVPGEPPATSAPVERAPSSPVETAVPAAVELASGGDKLSTSTQTLDPSSHAPVAVEYLGHATPRPSSHHGVFSDEIHASQRCMHGGIIPAPVLVESSPASVPVELPGSISAAPPTPFLASEPPASLSVERHASPQLSSHHSASTEPHVSPL